MKRLFILAVLLVGAALTAMSQTGTEEMDHVKVLVDNDVMKVTEFVSSPGKDVCGPGQHSHNAHLTVVLTDMKAEITNKDGEKSEAVIDAGTSFWSEADTHSAINVGDKPAKVLLIENKATKK